MRRFLSCLFPRRGMLTDPDCLLQANAAAKVTVTTWCATNMPTTAELTACFRPSSPSMQSANWLD